MIVLDDDESTPIKSALGPPHAQQDSELPLPVTATEQAPPAYFAGAGSDAGAAQGPPIDSDPYAGPYPYLLAANQRRFRRTENAKRRFWKAFGVAIIIWMLIFLLVESIEVSVRPRKVRSCCFMA